MGLLKDIKDMKNVVAAAPDEPHRIRDWSVPLWHGETPMTEA